METEPISQAGISSPDQDFRRSWQRSLSTAFRSVEDLLSALQLTPEDLLQAGVRLDPESSFPVLVPRSFLNRMRCRDPLDPLLRQVLPLSAENSVVNGFVSDAVGDSEARIAPGMLQKYRGRALLVASGACAVNCRYCFRREYPYSQEPRRLDDWEPALQQIATDTSLSEIIFSGGDPLMLNDGRLSELFRRVDSIAHVERIRIHTRLPIVLPARITDELLQLLQGLRAQAIFVVHANHPQEIAADCEDALRRTVRAGIPVLNQSVLLKHVNDSVDALEELSLRLTALGVMPYYLHQLDPVQGTAHFEVDPAVGLKLIEELRVRLPGYAVPRFVKEIAGEPGKTPVEQLIL